MLISSVEISGYRNLRSIRIPLDDITVIIGENNSGKTNVLEAVAAGLRVNRTVRQGAFGVHDYNLASPNSMAGDAGPIKITVTFEERAESEWVQAIANALQDVIGFHKTEPLRKITLQVSSEPARQGTDETYDWNFLDSDGNALPNKRFTALNRLQTLRPFYSLNAVRDASREFSKRSQFFGAFINDPTFDEQTKQNLTTALQNINTMVLAAHASFTVLKDNLDTGNSVVRPDVTSTSEIEAVPTRLTDLLENTQVSFSDRSGVRMPVTRQGSGTQSLAVVSLFRAFVEAKIKAHLEPLSEPILAIEEPECHLHPTAVRSVWGLLREMPGQKIITTHSGDLVSEVPISAIRRLKADDKGHVECRRTSPSRFSADELRLLNYNIKRTRGELFFANKWLLVEGKTEATALPEFAVAMGRDFRPRGIRLIEYASHGGPKPYIRLADDLGIDWHCLTDGDSAGDDYIAAATGELNGRNASDYITSLDKDMNFESFMCKHGFSATYAAHLSPQKQAAINAPHGSDMYWIQYGDAIVNTHKETVAIEICELVAKNLQLLPATLSKLITDIT